MKVCHLTSVHRQGDVRIFHKECSSLAKVYDTHMVVVNGKDEFRNNVKIHNIRIKFNSRLFRIWRVVNKVASTGLALDCDVYHIHDPELLRITRRLLKKGKIVIYDAHEDVPRQILGKYWIPHLFRKLISTVFEWYENKKVSELNYVIAATPHIRDRFLKLSKNVIDINNYPILWEYDLSETPEKSKNEFCYVGGLDDNRGISQITRAFGKVDAKLNLAGEFNSALYKSSVMRIPGWEQVNYLGFLNRKEVGKLIERSIAGMVTLKPLVNYLDSLPVKMFEYMSRGIPVIASNFPLWKSIIEDNGCGICVDPLSEEELINAINRITDNPEEARKMGDRGQKLVYEKYNWKIEEEKLLAVYESLSKELAISALQDEEPHPTRLLLLANHQSIHTIKWAKSLASRNIEIMIFSLSSGSAKDYKDFPNIVVIKGKHDYEVKHSDNFIKKSQYVFSLGRLKKKIREFKPDIVHAHYATSYGLLGALTKFHPLIISVWGSDVFDFPDDFLKKKLIQYNLSKANRILSTSHIMALETKKYIDADIDVTPFGIDIERFKPMEVESIFPEGSFVVGTIKALETKYGVEYLIKAFKKLKDRFPDMLLKLLIVGKGSKEQELKKLVRSLNLEDSTVFTGLVPHEKVPEYLNMLNIYVAVSILESESFGVAVLEASSCEIPVVVSRVGGLPEVVDEGKTGLVVSPKSVEETYEALRRLVENPLLKIEMAKAGRNRVIEHYDWDVCVEQLLQIYNEVLFKSEKQVN